jgi:hypothetical protein
MTRTMSSPTTVSNDRIREHAERLAAGSVTIGGLSTAFEESHASSVEVLVEGKAFYPPMLEDLASASSSIHINQFGFRPGVVGERFAEVLVATVVFAVGAAALVPLVAGSVRTTRTARDAGLAT